MIGSVQIDNGLGEHYKLTAIDADGDVGIVMLDPLGHDGDDQPVFYLPYASLINALELLEFEAECEGCQSFD